MNDTLSGGLNFAQSDSSSNASSVSATTDTQVTLQVPVVEPSSSRQRAERPIQKRDEKMTVYELWEEWTVGLDGGPSIRALEQEGTAWRRQPNESESRYFLRRKPVIQAIQDRINEGSTEEEATAFYESMRGSQSIYSLGKRLTTARRTARRDTAEEGTTN